MYGLIAYVKMYFVPFFCEGLKLFLLKFETKYGARIWKEHVLSHVTSFCNKKESLACILQSFCSKSLLSLSKANGTSYGLFETSKRKEKIILGKIAKLFFFHLSKIC